LLHHLCLLKRKTANFSALSHRARSQAHRKLLLGIPPPAIKAELAKRRLPPDLLDRDPHLELPAELSTQPVMVEFTEM
jgi:hypothetical protein